MDIREAGLLGAKKRYGEGPYKGKVQSVREYRERYPERAGAHRKVFVELRAGRLKKMPCFCGNTQVQAHHSDYFKPLKIKWLCKYHHIMADQKRNGKRISPPRMHRAKKDGKVFLMNTQDAGRKGGLMVAAKLSPSQRKARARKAAKARWAKAKKK